MPENEPLHWTEDDDLLSEYVLGRVPAEDAKRLETHLKSCPACREAVQRERAMASGIRQHAREEFKARLGTMVAERRAGINRLLTWQRAVSAAAIIVIVVGIGILNGWFTTSHRGFLSSDADRGEFGANAVTHAGDSTREQKESVPPLSRQPEAGQLQTESQGGKMTMGEIKADRIEKTKQSVAMESDQAARSTEGAAGATGKRKEAAAAAQDLDKMSANAKSKAPARELWGEGGSLPSLRSFGKKSAAAQRLLSQPEQQAGGGGARNTIVTQNFPPRQEIEFRQRRVELLPLARQKAAEDEPSQIQTLFQRTGRGTDITLYLDTLFSEEDLRLASVTRIAPDSIVVEMKSKRLGYRLPEVFLDSILGSWKKE
jgi:hypothetical protein